MSDRPIEIDPVFGCHVWMGSLNDNGRPVIWRGKQPVSAVREVYELELGKLKPDEFPDHLCRNILCVNVAHLEPVTRHENELRKSWAYRCRRKTCSKGHSLEHALVTPHMGRLCRTCHAESRAA